MPAPYRAVEETGERPARSLAKANVGRIALHIAITSVMVAGAGWLGWIALGTNSVLAPIVIALISLPIAADLARSIQELQLPHSVIADLRGLEFHWPEHAPRRPWMRMRHETVAWDKLVDLHTRTTQSGSSSTSVLLVHRAGHALPFEIPHGSFDIPAQALQQAILDERDDRFEAPKRVEANVAAFCAAAYQTPRSFKLRPNRSQRIGGTVIGGGVLALMVVLTIVTPGWAALVYTLPCSLVGGGILWATWAPQSPLHLRLDAEGLHAGHRPAQMRLYPWSEIRFARHRVINGTVQSVRVATHGGDDLQLEGDYGVPLPQLASLISPTVAAVVEARAARTASTSRPAARA